MQWHSRRSQIEGNERKSESGRKEEKRLREHEESNRFNIYCHVKLRCSEIAPKCGRTPPPQQHRSGARVTEERNCSGWRVEIWDRRGSKNYSLKLAKLSNSSNANHGKKKKREGNKREYQHLIFRDVIKDFHTLLPLG